MLEAGDGNRAATAGPLNTAQPNVTRSRKASTTGLRPRGSTVIARASQYAGAWTMAFALGG